MRLNATAGLQTQARPRRGRHRAARGGASRFAVIGAVAALVVGLVAYPSSAAIPVTAAASTSTAPCPVVTVPPTPAPTTTPGPTVLGGTFAGVNLDALQTATASTIVDVGKKMKVTRRGIRVALAVAMQESSLDPAATRGPYVGLFQQKSDPSSGLYTQYDRLDATGATTMFFQRLITLVPKYESDPRLDWQIGEVIQQTNVGRNVEQWFGLSEALTAKLFAAPVITLGAPASRVVATTPRATTRAVVPMRSAMVPGLRGARSAFAAQVSLAADIPIDIPTDIPTESDPSLSSAEISTSLPSAAAVSSSSSSSSSATPTDTATTTPVTTIPVTTTPVTTSPVTATTTTATTPRRTTTPTGTTARSTAPTTATTTTTTTKAPAATTAKATTSTAPATKVVPPNVSVNPDPPEPPVPTGSSDPDVRSDPSKQAITPNATAGTPASVDCSPSTNGGSTSFDPGMIISDAVFYNTKSMTVADLRTFINSKGAACTAAACLRLQKLSTPSEPADRYCAVYRGGTNEDFAAVVLKLSLACGINPQVMLVTLQKESALLTRTDVTAASYNAAYGWHCPDTGPGGSANCDPQYSGLFNQAYGMAKQWARYRIDPAKYNYRAGQTVNILWNVAPSGCGGSNVLIRNTATASLYDYTPYQPNAASLAAYPGVGDKCSSYGNRNFFFLFQKYFGVTGGGTDQNIGVNGVHVTLPTGSHVAAAAGGAVITAPTAAVAKGLAAGFAAVGLPYVYGGGNDGGGADQGCARAGGAENSCQGIVGFDCSGLTAYVLFQAGVQIPGYSGAQRAAGKSVPWSQGRPGDIIGYQGHVAIYLGLIKGTPYLLEAPDVGMYVQIRPVYYSNGGVPVDSSLHRYWR